MAISIRTSSYAGLVRGESGVAVHGLGYLIRNIDQEDSLLIVDDVFSSGLSMQAVIERLALKTRRNLPADIRIATPWYKPGKNRTERTPDYYLHETDEWLVFPYELDGLSMDELRVHKPAVLEMINEVIATFPDS